MYQESETGWPNVHLIPSTIVQQFGWKEEIPEIYRLFILAQWRSLRKPILSFFAAIYTIIPQREWNFHLKEPLNTTQNGLTVRSQ